jgi:hypothetical protein
MKKKAPMRRATSATTPTITPIGSAEFEEPDKEVVVEAPAEAVAEAVAEEYDCVAASVIVVREPLAVWVSVTVLSFAAVAAVVVGVGVGVGVLVVLVVAVFLVDDCESGQIPSFQHGLPTQQPAKCVGVVVHVQYNWPDGQDLS